MGVAIGHAGQIVADDALDRLALGALLERDGANRGLLRTAIGAGLLTAFLDMVEKLSFHGDF